MMNGVSGIFSRPSASHLKILPTSIGNAEPAYKFGRDIIVGDEVLASSPAVQTEMAQHGSEREEVEDVVLANLLCFG